ncbi:MAG: dual specificity protein phosphatase family protein [Nitrospiraceae bacterium]|nr:dual specificity protein phosphatase family protein [Nitrospiraceae bacterium]MDA8171318.1 dual specificity protein phosphatase family protein [Nitrospiraceae bacterium]
MKKTGQRVFVVVLVILLIPSGYYFLIFGDGNFHTVTPGEAYRCAQPGYDQLEHYLKAYGIRSIINLRGRNPGSNWYRKEIEFSKANGIAHYDVGLSATSEPTARQMQELMKILRTAPRPILIHCKSGADRSGLVAAMWKEAVDGQSKSKADRQLSIRFGHIPIAGTIAMDRAFLAWIPMKN